MFFIGKNSDKIHDQIWNEKRNE